MKANTIVARIYLPDWNILAYFAAASVKGKKVFKTLAPALSEHGNIFEDLMKIPREKIYSSDQCYKTFYHGNLPPFHGHSVLFSSITLVITVEWN